MKISSFHVVTLPKHQSIIWSSHIARTSFPHHGSVSRETRMDVRPWVATLSCTSHLSRLFPLPPELPRPSSGLAWRACRTQLSHHLKVPAEIPSGVGQIMRGVERSPGRASRRRDGRIAPLFIRRIQPSPIVPCPEPSSLPCQ